MIRKVWVNSFVSSSTNSETGAKLPDVWINAHWETISGSEAYVNSIYSGSRYEGMPVKKNDGGTFGGRYEHHTWEEGDVANDNDGKGTTRNTGQWEQND